MGVNPAAAKEHLVLLTVLNHATQPGASRSDPMNFSEWIQLQASLQRTIGVDPRDLGPTPERSDFVRWNVLAAIAELMEALDEMPWKPWATTTQFNRKAVIAELVDAMHFIANVLRVVDATGEELTQEYLRKNRRNLERQLEGYDGKTGKCGACGRELSDLADQGARVQHAYHHDGPHLPGVVEFCNRDHLDTYEETLETR